MRPCPYDPTTDEQERAPEYSCPWCGCPVEAGAAHPPCVEGCRRWSSCADCGHFVGWHFAGSCWEIDDCTCTNAPYGTGTPLDFDPTWTGSWLSPGQQVIEDRAKSGRRGHGQGDVEVASEHTNATNDSPISRSEDRREAENAAALAAVEAWALSEGVGVVIDTVRERFLDADIPAPGLEQRLDDVRLSASLATYAADALDELSASDDADSRAASDEAVRNLLRATTRATTGLRALAQLLFGVIAITPSDPYVYQVERAAVAAMRRSDSLGFSSALVNEAGLKIAGTDVADLRVEVAGLLSRVMIDRNTFVIVAGPNGSSRYVQFLTGDDGDLRTESVGDSYLGDNEKLTADDQVLLAELGWLSPAEGSPNYYRDWPGPISLAKPAELLARTLVEVHGYADLSALTVTTGETT